MRTNCRKSFKKTQIKNVTENTLGLISEVMDLVASKGINIEDSCTYSVDNKAIIYLITNDNERAMEVLKK
jgi:hypothetical protein